MSFKKECKNCIHVAQDEYIVGKLFERCTYVIGSNDNSFSSVKKDVVHPIPSIDNANFNCPYYEESFLTKALRRFKK